MKEALVEQRLTDKLTAKGFKVLKLTTPGYGGTPDRLILRPKWSPGPPWVIELKAPKKHERRLQELVREDWRSRGVLVLDMVDTYEKVDALVLVLYGTCLNDKTLAGTFKCLRRDGCEKLTTCYLRQECVSAS